MSDSHTCEVSPKTGPKLRCIKENPEPHPTEIASASPNLQSGSGEAPGGQMRQGEDGCVPLARVQDVPESDHATAEAAVDTVLLQFCPDRPCSSCEG
jgi:hypothetical protein